jgi:small subunit ribosomal protein S1
MLSQLEKEINKSFGGAEEGSLVEGTVVQLDNDTVYLDIGLKLEGKIPLNEFKMKPVVGDKVSCLLINKEMATVSKKQADHKMLMKKFNTAFENKESVEGKIVKAVKGGFDVDLGSGLMAFLPISKVDMVKVEDPATYIGLEGDFLIDRLTGANGKSNIVVTRRDFLEKEHDRKRAEFFKTAKVGDVVEGFVKTFTSFGAFIDLGGFDGLLHLNDMSWGHASRPKDYVKKDDKIQLIVLKLDEEKNRINLSIKHFNEDPWANFPDRYMSWCSIVSMNLVFLF